MHPLTQITYLQVGATAVKDAWGPPSLKSDAIRAAAQFRDEVKPLTAAIAAGRYTAADLRGAAALLAARYAPDADAEGAVASALGLKLGQRGEDDGNVNGGQDVAGDTEIEAIEEDQGAGGSTGAGRRLGGGSGSNGGSSSSRELMDALLRQPFGEVLLSRAAAGPLAWSAAETEYGRWAFAWQLERWCLGLGVLGLRGRPPRFGCVWYWP